jgi:hypothetical protein
MTWPSFADMDRVLMLAVQTRVSRQILDRQFLDRQILDIYG